MMPKVKSGIPAGGRCCKPEPLRSSGGKAVRRSRPLHRSCRDRWRSSRPIGVSEVVPFDQLHRRTVDTAARIDFVHAMAAARFMEIVSESESDPVSPIRTTELLRQLINAMITATSRVPRSAEGTDKGAFIRKLVRCRGEPRVRERPTAPELRT